LLTGSGLAVTPHREPFALPGKRASAVFFRRQAKGLEQGGMMATTGTVNIAILRNVPLFAMLPEDQLQKLAGTVVRRSFPKGSVVMSAGDPTETLYIIISGGVKVQVSDDDGHEVILTVLGPGEFFGEMALLDDHPRSASIVTSEPCEMICLAKNDFKKCLADNIELTMYIMRSLVKRLRDADKNIESLALLDVYGRVARILLAFAEDVDGQMVVKKKIPKQDIAKMIGASREMVSRVMKDLQAKGYIEMVDGRMIVRTKLAVDE
jgi:CRP/FNR family cyclic AMP-dependent transcriptional regulator